MATAPQFALSDRACLELRGEDRVSWLQGQATNDVSGLSSVGNRRSFCFCEPNGSLLAVIDAWAFSDRIVMTTDRERMQAVLDRIERMTILEDVEAAETGLYGFTVDELLPSEEGYFLPSDFGGEVWLPESLAPSSLPTVPEEIRLARGTPKWGVDMGPKTLPPELGPAFEAMHVSYKKGCYTGQEVLMRLHSRGHTNRTWVGLAGAGSLQVGDPVVFDGKAVGTVSSAADSPEYGPIAAAMLRNEATVEGTRVLVGETEAEVRQLPFLRTA